MLIKILPAWKLTSLTTVETVYHFVGNAQFKEGKWFINSESAWCPFGGGNFQHLTSTSSSSKVPWTHLGPMCAALTFCFSCVAGDILPETHTPFLLAVTLQGSYLSPFSLTGWVFLCLPKLVFLSPHPVAGVFFFFFLPPYWAAEVVPQWKFKHLQVSSQLSLCFLRVNRQFLLLQEILFLKKWNECGPHSLCKKLNFSLFSNENFASFKNISKY